MTPLFVLFACIFAFCNAAPEFRKIQTQIVFVNETEFLRDHPELKLIPLEKTVLRDGDDDTKLRYTLGKPGDPFVTAFGAKSTLPYNEEIYVTIDYPGNTNFTQTITYIEADVTQDSTDGNLYLSKGKLGDPSNITFQAVVYCSIVTEFDIVVNLYGH